LPDVIDLEVREHKGRLVAEPAAPASIARSVGELATSLWLASMRAGFEMTRTVVRSAAESRLGQFAGEALHGAVTTASRELAPQWGRVEQATEQRIGQVIAIAAPVVVRSLDIDELVEYIDINAILAAVDVDALLEQVDVNALLDRVDVDDLMERVDVNGLMARVDVDGLMARVDVDALISRVDVDALMAKVDIDALLNGVDVAALAKRADIGELVAESTSSVAGSALDVGRRQAVGVEAVLTRTVDRLLGRDPETMPVGPPLLVDREDDGDGEE
jgi:hypothetical protein